jgi:hypothetical protein
LLWMYFPQNWEFGAALSELQNFRGGGVWTPPQYATAIVQTYYTKCLSNPGMSRIVKYRMKKQRVQTSLSYLVTWLTFWSLLVTWCTNSLTVNNSTFCPHCICVSCIYLWTNSELCHFTDWFL